MGEPGGYLDEVGERAVRMVSEHADEHEAWWRAFWQRSWIHVKQASAAATGRLAVPADAHAVRIGVDQHGGNRFTSTSTPCGRMGSSLAATQPRTESHSIPPRNSLTTTSTSSPARSASGSCATSASTTGFPTTASWPTTPPRSSAPSSTCSVPPPSKDASRSGRTLAPTLPASVAVSCTAVVSLGAESSAATPRDRPSCTSACRSAPTAGRSSTS